MKKTLLMVSAAVAMMVAVGCQAPQQNVAVASTNGESVELSVAYINTDSLILNYDYAKKKSEELLSKEESSRAELNQKGRVFQQEVAEFQRKVQNNGFLSVDRAQKEQERLAKKEQELAELQQKLSEDLMRQQQTFNMELRDTLTMFLESWAKDKYKLILSNNMGDNVLYSAPGVDVTNEVVEILNARYSAAKK
jgi:outer membrane protein